MFAEHCNPLWGKGLRGETAQARMGRRIQEKHLLHHHLSDGVQFGKPHRLQFFRCRCAVGRKVMQHANHVGVAGHNPRVEKRIPVNRIFGPKSMEKGIGICQHFGVEKLVETQAGVGLHYRTDVHIRFRHIVCSLPIRLCLKLDRHLRLVLVRGVSLVCINVPGAQPRNLG